MGFKETSNAWVKEGLMRDFSVMTPLIVVHSRTPLTHHIIPVFIFDCINSNEIYDEIEIPCTLYALHSCRRVPDMRKPTACIEGSEDPKKSSIMHVDRLGRAY